MNYENRYGKGMSLEGGLRDLPLHEFNFGLPQTALGFGSEFFFQISSYGPSDENSGIALTKRDVLSYHVPEHRISTVLLDSELLHEQHNRRGDPTWLFHIEVQAVFKPFYRSFTDWLTYRSK